MTQNDVIKLESAVENCNTLDSRVIVIKYAPNSDFNTGSILEFK